MNEIVSSGLWPRLRQLAKRAKRKFAAVAYVTDDRFVKFGEGDVLVTDASDEAIKSGQTSAAVLRSAFQRKAELVSIRGLHSKVYVFDRYAVIGSANLSKGSEKRTEAALISDLPTVVSASRLLVEQLRNAGKVIDEAFISRISQLPVTKRRMIPAGPRPKRQRDLVPRTWLVGLAPAKEKQDEQAVADDGMKAAEKLVGNRQSDISWMRIRGNSRFRREAKPGDLVICIWSEDAKTPPNVVYHHSPILLRKDDTIHDITWFFVEDFPDAHKTTLTWRQFQKLYSRIGLRRKLGKWVLREMAASHSDALHDLWFDQK